MRKFLLALVVLIGAQTVEAAPVVKNDTTGVSTPLTFNSAKGVWLGGPYTLTVKGPTTIPTFSLTVGNLPALPGRPQGGGQNIFIFGPFTNGVTYTVTLGP